MCAQIRKRTSQAQQSLLEPSVVPNTLQNRDEWIEKAVEGFATRSPANRLIYRVLLETLWPKNHGIPGPIVSREEIREAVNKAKGKEYRDVFRRMRELQGDEGFLGIIKYGQKYQLIHLNISPKKKPRTSLSVENWRRVLEKYGNTCAACGCDPDENGFQQDHKVPRARGGSDDLANWQTGNRFAIRAILIRASLAEAAKRIAHSADGHFQNSIDRLGFLDRLCEM